jgi:hypothetical protein
MKIFEKLFNKDAKTKDELTQAEREAIVDLLTLGVYADNHLSLAEDETFEAITNKMNWESDRDISYYIYTATERARQARTDEGAIEEFLKFVAERLDSRTSASHALDLLQRLFSADGSTEKENQFYRKVENILRN